MSLDSNQSDGTHQRSAKGRVFRTNWYNWGVFWQGTPISWYLAKSRDGSAHQKNTRSDSMTVHIPLQNAPAEYLSYRYSIVLLCPLVVGSTRPCLVMCNFAQVLQSPTQCFLPFGRCLINSSMNHNVHGFGYVSSCQFQLFQCSNTNTYGFTMHLGCF